MAPYMLSSAVSPEAHTPSLASGSDFGGETIAKPATAEPIAICGMACRLPGDVYSASDLWKLLVNARSAQGQVPKSRFNIDAFSHPKGADRPGSMNATGGYFLQDDIREFENDFFGINNMEATFMDPQQRKLLEVVFECFESAGVTLENASGSNTGCYVGNFTVDFQVMQNRDPEYFHRYSATGMGTTILGNRISHAFNLTGPSLVIDTACSSSLYCLHTACVALENGECDAAVVAGANLIQSAEQHLGTMRAGVLSATSTCHTFDESADGYGRADGIGALYIKRLSDAIRDGDPVRSIIRGTAINANGKTNGITLPSASGQAAVIRKAYAKANLDPRATSYVECHGTGTAVGDPIEVEAVSKAIASTHTDADPLLIGSVKTNLGHSEAASGITSVMKVALGLENSYIAPTIGVRRLNPKIKSQEWNVEVVTQGRPWPGKDIAQRAGVNSFGYGGANSHAILESPVNLLREKHDLLAGVAKALSTRTTYILPFSAATNESLEARINDIAAYELDGASMADLAYTLIARRSKLAKSGVALTTSSGRTVALGPLQQLNAPPFGALPFAFIFTGQGAQWAGMGKELLTEFPEFSRTIDEMDDVLSELPNGPTWTLRSILQEPEATSRINEVDQSQPICTALQVGLIHLLQSWDIQPSAVAGHSSGEIAAAYAAGHLTLRQAIASAYYRGYVVAKNIRDGAMLAAGMSRESATSKIASLGLEDNIRVACINSPESVTISGDADAVDLLLKNLQSENIFARKLKTGGRAYHSHHMQALGDEYERLLNPLFTKSDRCDYLSTETKFFSSVTGKLRTAGFGPRYWRNNLESPVEFTAAVTAVSQDTRHQLIELGPHSALEMPIKQIRTSLSLAESDLPYLAAISRGKNAIDTVLTLAGKLSLHGQAIDLLKVNGLAMPSKLGAQHPFKVLHDLPPYRWHYDGILWNEARASTEFRQRKHRRHELLGSRRPGDTNKVQTWRNLLKVEDVDWLMDHKLEDTVVFPGAGYVSMAVEAMLQIAETDYKATGVAIHLQNVNILRALALSTAAAAQVEINTVLRPKHLSDITMSEMWWEFEISSSSDTTTTLHATGLVGLAQSEGVQTSKLSPPTGSLEPIVPRTWYDKLTQSGLNFGPQFQSITEFDVPRMKSTQHCTSQVPLLQQSTGDGSVTYPVHPITIDAMLQTAIVATASGKTTALRAKVPTKISKLIINLPALQDSGDKWHINATAAVVGFGAANIQAELCNQHDRPLASMHDVRLAPYEAAGQVAVKDKRHPMLRVLWKPDISGIGLMRPEDFTAFVTEFATESKSKIRDEGLLKLGAALNLTSHKRPASHILEVGNNDLDQTMATLKLLYADHAFRRLRSYTTATVDEAGEFTSEPVDLDSGEPGKASKIEGTYDLVLLPNILTANSYLLEKLETLEQFINDDGLLVAICDDARITPALFQNMEVVESPLARSSARIIVAKKARSQPFVKPTNEKPLVLVERLSTQLGEAVRTALTRTFDREVVTLALRQVNRDTVPKGATVVSMIEAGQPFLATSTDDEMAQVKALTDNASTILWITAGDLLRGRTPDYALAAGMSRALMLEQPSLSFLTYDLDSTTENVDRSAHLIARVLQQSAATLDYEFMQRDGVVHVSRFIADDKINDDFRRRQGLETQAMQLQHAAPCQVSIDIPGQFDSIYFKQIDLPAVLDDGEVQVQMKALGVNAKDFYALGGKVDTKDATCSLEYCGVVERVGYGVTSVAPGDRVMVMAPGHFKTSEIVPHWACKKLLDEEAFTTMSTLGVVYATALYALRDKAQLKASESVLIHSAAGGVGIAAIQIAQMMGAEIYGTVSSQEKRDYLQNTFGIKPENLFTSRDTSFREGLMAATGGKGADVVLNSLTGEMLHASWECCAAFGRFVEIGKFDLTNGGRLDMQQFLKNVTFSAFDLSNLYSSENESQHKEWSQLMQDVLDLYRAKKIMSIDPLEVFDVTDLTKAMRQFGSRNRMGKIAISLEDDESYINVRPHKYATKFSPAKAYLMVGCLGGLGRSMSKYMMARGARNFVFLGRSGLDKAPARRLVNELQHLGAVCHVIRGDVCQKTDVEALVNAAPVPIGGVVQAAMGLNEALFSQMSNEFWHTGIDPKVVGTWNLHNALMGRDAELDFFLTTSSVSGTVGTATESNYCAANYFLDNFVRYRRSLGLPAVSIGIGMVSEVGYLHENPEIEKLLLRKGILPINEDELLQVFDTALSSGMRISHAHDQGAEAHILTGLEPLGVLELRRRGFEVSNLALDDPRASILASSLDDELDRANSSAHGALPAEVAQAVQEGTELAEAISKHICRRFSDLILLPLNKVDIEKVLSGYGMDSMIAAEFRTWFFKAFKVDIPFLELLSETVTLSSLSAVVTAEVEARG